MKPIIKWVGGKSQLAQKIRELMPPTYNKYYEPFAGGLAVLLELNPTNSTINDINPELINVYQQIRDHVDDVISHLSKYDKQHEMWSEPKDYYYRVREYFNTELGTNTAKQAARFIYLNKHCFNGLYRVNSKGEFNVPFNGKLSGRSYDPDHLHELSSRLKNTSILNVDFEIAVKDASVGDFVYFDPPYDKDEGIQTGGFVAYQKDGWTIDDLIKLRRVCDELTTRGCKVMLSNNNTTFIRDLFSGYYITEVDVRRSINRNGSNRKGKEVIITNYKT
jgi:DNA adenine methylase